MLFAKEKGRAHSLLQFFIDPHDGKLLSWLDEEHH